MRGANAAALLLVLVCTVRRLSAAGQKKPAKVGWRLPHHSFERTLSYDDNLEQWLASAGSIPLRDRLQMLPPVPNRYGLFWSKKPLLTKDFEVKFTLSAFAGATEDGSSVRDGALAFWLSPDSMAHQYDEKSVVNVNTKDWYEGLQSIGFKLLSNRPNFRGLALTFADTGRPTAQEAWGVGAKVGAVWSDGAKDKVLADLTSTSSGAQAKEVAWLSSGTQVRVRVTPDGAIRGMIMTLDVRKHIVGALWGFAQDGVNSKGMVGFQANGQVTWNDKEVAGEWKMLNGNKLGMRLNGVDHVVRFEGSTRAVIEEPKSEPPAMLLYGGQDTGEHDVDWTDLISFPPGTVTTKEVFMGFSGYTGTKSSIEVNVHRLVTTNFDDKVVGEEESDILDLKQWMEVLEKEKRYVDQASQGDAVLSLTKLLNTHIETCDKDGNELRGSLLKMEDKLDNLGTDMATYLAAAKAYSFESQRFEPEILKGHITNIRTMLTSSREKHDEKLSKIDGAAKDLKGRPPGQLSEDSKRKVKSVQEQSKIVEDMAAAGSSQANYLLLVMVGSVGGVAILFLKRMRYYEKKHYI